jgi:hypothetical protein
MGTFTALHVVISLVAILSGLVIILGMIAGKRFERGTVLFLAATGATSITGFIFPFHGITPAIAVGLLSVVLVAMAVLARYSRRLLGAWRWVYVVSAATALYFNVFVLVVQFQNIPSLNVLAPTQSEPPFAITQLVVLAVFVAVSIAAAVRFRVQPEAKFSTATIHR